MIARPVDFARCFERRGALDAPIRAVAMRAAAALLRAGCSPQAAFLNWHTEAPEAARRPLEGLRRRLVLGQPLGPALESLRESFGDDASVLAIVVGVHSRLGGDLARSLDRLADAAEERAALGSQAHAAASGALLSGRVVAGLPAVLAVLAPARVAMDAGGLATLGMGAALTIAGLVWIGRLVPRPPPDDPVAALADVVAGVLHGGAPLWPALDTVSERMRGTLETDLRAARRRAHLGAPWPVAFAHSAHAGLADFGTTLRRAFVLGVPVRSALHALATRRRAERLREFETSLRRAPVLMVMPLSFCVLPAYALLALAPYLRGF